MPSKDGRSQLSYETFFPIFVDALFSWLEMKPGMTAIQVAPKEDFHYMIRDVMEAVKYGELDILGESAGKKGTAELRLKQKPMPVKKAS